MRQEKKAGKETSNQITKLQYNAQDALKLSNYLQTLEFVKNFG
jgi:hypothetical protein